MVNAGIVTFHRAENFGSVLQAFALQTALQNMGCDAWIIDAVLPGDMEQYRLFRTGFYLERPKAFLADLVYFNRNRLRRRRFDAFRKRYFHLSRDLYQIGRQSLAPLNKNFDAFICGSDQIWNLDCTKGIIPDFFLAFAANDRLKIAYAPSMPEEPGEECLPELNALLNRLDAISVREVRTKAFLEARLQLNQPVFHAVDPTLLLRADDYIQALSLKSVEEERYIFLYALGSGEIVRRMAEEALRLKRETGLNVRYVYHRYIRALAGEDYRYGAGPDDFLNLIRGAAYVITDSFHATVFSLLFKVPFHVFARPGSSSRMIELLEAVGMLENSCGDGENVPARYLAATDETGEKLAEMAGGSLAFLKTSLGIKE